MFLLVLGADHTQQGFPRVSGDVSISGVLGVTDNKFSPRERGCF